TSRSAPHWMLPPPFIAASRGSLHIAIRPPRWPPASQIYKLTYVHGWCWHSGRLLFTGQQDFEGADELGRGGLQAVERRAELLGEGMGTRGHDREQLPDGPLVGTGRPLDQRPGRGRAPVGQVPLRRLDPSGRRVALRAQGAGQA